MGQSDFEHFCFWWTSLQSLKEEKKPSLSCSACPYFHLQLRLPRSSMACQIKCPAACFSVYLTLGTLTRCHLNWFLSMHRRSSLTQSFSSKFRINELLHREWALPPMGTLWCDPYTYRYISPTVNHPCSNIQWHTWPIHDPFCSKGDLYRIHKAFLVQLAPHHPETPSIL